MGIQAVVAPRYYMDLLLFPVGMLWLLFEDAEARRDGASRMSAVACIAIAAIVFAGHAWTYRVEWKTAPSREIAFERAEARSFAAGRRRKTRGRCRRRSRRGPGRGDHARAQVVGLPARRCVRVQFRRVRWVDGWYGAGQGEIAG